MKKIIFDLRNWTSLQSLLLCLNHVIFQYVWTIYSHYPPSSHNWYNSNSYIVFFISVYHLLLILKSSFQFNNWVIKRLKKFNNYYDSRFTIEKVKFLVANWKSRSFVHQSKKLSPKKFVYETPKKYINKYDFKTPSVNISLFE